ncbi:MAG: hypothetical protein LBR21_05665 [Propionibacteriaceae bacterium]|jgi:1-phosphatidylinositol phosphodiesterase|nr:hypothetical protein [Propionibacteriaceae bacterium]
MNTDWMAAINADTPINWLAMPGTHDTMTAPCEQVYYHTQNLTLPEQLDAGVRYLDLRITKNLVAAHREWISDISFASILETIRDFLAQHPSEVIVARIQNANERKDDYPEYGQAILSEIKKNLDLFWVPGKGWPTLTQARGKIVALECSPAEYGLTRVDGQRWASAWHENPLLEIQDLWDGPSIEAKREAILTAAIPRDPDPDVLVVNHISASNGELVNPVSYADELNPYTAGLLDGIGAVASDRSGRRIGAGLYAFDFVDADLSAKVIALNLPQG